MSSVIKPNGVASMNRKILTITLLSTLATSYTYGTDETDTPQKRAAAEYLAKKKQRQIQAQQKLAESKASNIESPSLSQTALPSITESSNTSNREVPLSPTIEASSKSDAQNSKAEPTLGIGSKLLSLIPFVGSKSVEKSATSVTPAEGSSPAVQKKINNLQPLLSGDISQTADVPVDVNKSDVSTAAIDTSQEGNVLTIESQQAPTATKGDETNIELVPPVVKSNPTPKKGGWW